MVTWMRLHDREVEGDEETIEALVLLQNAERALRQLCEKAEEACRKLLKSIMQMPEELQKSVLIV